MRKLTVLAAAVALMVAPTAMAQPQPQQPPGANAPTTPNDQSTMPTIKEINVVDINELPATTQTAVNESVAKSSEAELVELRASIDSSPELKSALVAEGVTSAEVIAASIGQNGSLTLITKKPG